MLGFPLLTKHCLSLSKVIRLQNYFILYYKSNETARVVPEKTSEVSQVNAKFYQVMLYTLP
jgi:hypothetical protein